MFDVTVIGAGPAGYVAVDEAARLGMKTLLVEKDSLGGVCLNTGCVPTKTWLHCAKLYDHAKKGTPFGVRAADVTLDFPAVRARADRVRDALRNGVAGLMKKAKADVLFGTAAVTSPKTVAVDGKPHETKHILVCTGSHPVVPPIPGLAGNPIAMTNGEFLALPALPKRLVVIGGGVIGTEFATFAAIAGSEVAVIEMLPQICGAVDADVARVVQQRLESRGAKVFTGAKVVKVDGGRVHFLAADGKEQTVDADGILVAAGRAPNVEGLGLEAARIDFDGKGIRVDDRGRTNVPGVYAAGDATGRWQLAHFASRQATVAVRTMAGIEDRCREDAIPAVVYGDPEVASVGLTERSAKEKGIAVKALKMPLGASGRFLAETEGERGFVKAVVGASRGEILGMQVVGPYASEMIGAACVMVEAELRGRDVRDVVFPHPTVSELMRDIFAGA